MEKVLGKAVERLVGSATDSVTDLLKKIAGPAAEEVGRTIQDSVKVWRIKRQYLLLQKLRAFVEERGFEPRQIPLKVLLPSLEYASVEEDEDLHTTWATLLASAADPALIEMPVSFPEILRQLSPRDANLLWATYKEALDRHLPIEKESSLPQELVRARTFLDVDLFFLWNRLGYAPAGCRGLSSAEQESPIGAQRRKDYQEFSVALDNLVRLGLLERGIHLSFPVPRISAIEEGQLYLGRVLPHDKEWIYAMSNLGCRFVHLCHGSSGGSMGG
jgi:hypothetical protein